MIPSLFRSAKSKNHVNNLIKAEDILEAEIKKTFSQMRRFSERHITAILQHYGVKTSWIDLVDNLYIAVWFALHKQMELNSNNFKFIKSKSHTGWIRFIQTKVEGQPLLRSRDLRYGYLPLSLRPHAQHGISATRWGRQHWTFENIDLSTYVVASVEIPNDKNLWQFTGFMAESDFLFPNEGDDHTYRVLLRKEMEQLLAKIESKFDLKNEALGRIDKYS